VARIAYGKKIRFLKERKFEFLEYVGTQGPKVPLKKIQPIRPSRLASYS